MNKTLTEIVLGIESEKRNKITELKEAVASGNYQVSSKVLTGLLVEEYIQELSLLEGRRHLCLRDVRRRNFLRTFIRVSTN